MYFRDSFKKFQTHDYTKAFSEEDIDIGPIKGFSNPRYNRKPPEGPSIDLPSEPIKVNPEVVVTTEQEYTGGMRNKTVAWEDPVAPVEPNNSTSKLEAYKRSAYASTYKSDYIIE